MMRRHTATKVLFAALLPFLLLSACGNSKKVEMQLDSSAIDTGLDPLPVDMRERSAEDVPATELPGLDQKSGELPEISDTTLEQLSPPDVQPDGGQTYELEPLAELVVANPGAFSRYSSPVSRSVPLAAAAGVFQADTLFLEDAEGALVAAGITPMARWGGATDDETIPVKWVLVEFVTDLGSQQEKSFTLMKGTAPRPEPTVLVEQTAGYLVQTGPCNFVVAPEDGGLLAEASCGGESFFAPPMTPTTVVTLPDGTALAMADFPPDSVEITRQTDVSVEVTVTGALGQVYGWKRPLSYTALLTFYGGTGLMDVLFRLENRNKAVHPGNIWLQKVSNAE
jgi:hypothetical protein